MNSGKPSGELTVTTRHSDQFKRNKYVLAKTNYIWGGVGGQGFTPQTNGDLYHMTDALAAYVAHSGAGGWWESRSYTRGYRVTSARRRTSSGRKQNVEINMEVNWIPDELRRQLQGCKKEKMVQEVTMRGGLHCITHTHSCVLYCERFHSQYNNNNMFHKPHQPMQLVSAIPRIPLMCSQYTQSCCCCPFSWETRLWGEQLNVSSGDCLGDPGVNLDSLPGPHLMFLCPVADMIHFDHRKHNPNFCQEGKAPFLLHTMEISFHI